MTVTRKQSSDSRPEKGRAAILRAAVEEFGRCGMDGARTSTIAHSAGVNQALLYYYFRDKQALYAAVFEEVMGSRFRILSAILDDDIADGEKVLRFVCGHFDYLVQHAAYPKLVLEAFSSQMSRPLTQEVILRYVKPLSIRLAALIERGAKTGEFRAVDAPQFSANIAGLCVFQFAAAPVARLIMGRDPLSPAWLKRRRAAILDTTAAALFTDRERGLKLAAQVLANAKLPRATVVPDCGTLHGKRKVRRSK